MLDLGLSLFGLILVGIGVTGGKLHERSKWRKVTGLKEPVKVTGGGGSEPVQRPK